MPSGSPTFFLEWTLKCLCLGSLYSVTGSQRSIGVVAAWWLLLSNQTEYITSESADEI